MSNVLVVAMIAAGGCASVRVNPESLRNVKTVAIVNLTASNQMEKGGTGGGSGIGDTINGIRDLRKMAGGQAQSEYRNRMEVIYDALVDKVATTGFSTPKRTEVAANPNFPIVYTKLTRVDLGGDPGSFVANGRQINLRNLDIRKQVLDALGVDALASAEVTFQTGKTGGASIGGFGALKRYPQAVVTFFVYDRTSPNPIWADYRVIGAPAHDGLQETMGVADTKDATPLFLEAANSAFDLLVSRLQKARQAPTK
jgi:hypothetical protein